MSGQPIKDVNTSSVFELRAELLKKQHEYELEKQSADSHDYRRAVPKKKGAKILGLDTEPCKKSKLSSGKSLNSVEDASLLEKSRAALERKELLYEKLRLGESVDELTEDQLGNIMVDFTRKDWDEDSKTFKTTAYEQPVQSSSATSEWTDYIDEFGRTRQIRTFEMEKILAERAKAEAELHRRSELEVEDKPVVPIHYDESKEIRSKGVGYFKFASSEKERQQQLVELSDLRHNTVEARARSRILIEQRKLQKDLRLHKVQERRKRLTQNPDSANPQ